MPELNAPFANYRTSRRRALTLLGGLLSGASGLLAACSTPDAKRHNPAPRQAAPGSSPLATQDRPALYRLVNRLSWGACDSELNMAAQLGATRYIGQQLNPGPPALLSPAAQKQIDDLTISQKPLTVLLADLDGLRQADDKQPYQKELSRLGREAATRHLLRALYSPQQLREHMTWFWLNHFNVHMHKHNIRALIGDYEERALRPHALGRFRDMLGAVAHHPAMLRYLDNEQNAADRLNENYARELLELHTLGVDGAYSQRDVQELARVLTGHGVQHADKMPKLRRELAGLYVREGAYEFNPARHDFGNKTVLGHTIQGRGAAELNEVLDRLAAHPSTARFISRKMARYLLIDQPDPALVQRMADVFLSSNGHIGETLQVLLNSPQFTQSEPGKFKDPMHFVLSAVRAAYDDKLVLNINPIINWLNRMGEGLYNRPTPDGYPQTEEEWASSGQMAVRFDVAKAIGTHNAGLFKTEEGPARSEQAAFPQLARASYYQYTRALLRDDTRKALDNTASPQDWNTLYLSSPEFQYR
ncbi:MAG: DUF1800 domain-containing protein [Aquabacterium sp.]|uniref:DUF1800 domain-containing protein n=1 Tax=Aquabacterium sp. TaxID=1872578 RepID=UPI00121C7867|nr:DUF1800 domain-containing protein [Aquabacterium sp.]TAK93371.1 MAG: DUF1800 domain-containing protein [Aquabacterium sp.]